MARHLLEHLKIARNRNIELLLLTNFSTKFFVFPKNPQKYVSALAVILLLAQKLFYFLNHMNSNGLKMQ